MWSFHAYHARNNPLHLFLDLSTTDTTGGGAIPHLLRRGTGSRAGERVEAENTDTGTLRAALEAHVDGEVRFDAGSRAAYAHDGSNYRQVPIGVVVPRSAAAAVAAVAVCREAGAPVLSRGGGTSLAGQCCNEAVVIDLPKYCPRVVVVYPG